MYVTVTNSHFKIKDDIKIQINHQPDATIFQFIILTFIYNSTSFGRSPAHHQGSMTAVTAAGFTFVSW
jgi:hypothetical protein